MSSISLAEAEKSLYTLWTKREPREVFLEGNVPQGVNSEYIDGLDPKGINLYSSLIRTGQNDLMNSIYPGCAGLIGKGFEDIIGKYFEHFPAEHHNFNRAAERFSLYLEGLGEDVSIFPALSVLPTTMYSLRNGILTMSGSSGGGPLLMNWRCPAKLLLG